MRWDDTTYLELVLSGLSLRRWVEEIDCENLEEQCQYAIFMHRCLVRKDIARVMRCPAGQAWSS